MGLFLAGLCVLVTLLAHALYHAQWDDTDIPNDWFALPAAAMDEEAEEAMMLKIACLTFDD